MGIPVLGIVAMGRSLAMAGNSTAKHAIKRVNRFLGNVGVDLEVACGDLIATVVGGAREVVLTLDWTDPKTKDGQFQTLSINLRAHGRATEDGSQGADARIRRSLVRESGRVTPGQMPSSSWRTVALPRYNFFAFWPD